MARLNEQELQYCPRLTPTQIVEEFGEHASGMLRHYQDRYIDNCIDQDTIRNNEELTKEQKAIGLVFFKWLNDEPFINKAIKHCERVVNMRRYPSNKMIIPLEMVKNIPIQDLTEFKDIRKIGSTGKLKTFCPFYHATPSHTFVINQNNTFICFNCGAKGSNIDFIMKLNNCDMPTAVRYLQKVKR